MSVYNVQENIHSQLSYHSKWEGENRETIAYKPLAIHNRVIQIFRVLLTGIEMSEYDPCLLSDAQIQFEIWCEKVKIRECERSELDETIKKIYKGEISLPN